MVAGSFYINFLKKPKGDPKKRKRVKPQSSRKQSHASKKERPPLLNKSQHLPKVVDLLAEREENTIRKSKKTKRQKKRNSVRVKKSEETQSKRVNSQMNEKVLKMFLERQKEYRGRLENLEKKTDSSHQMLEDLFMLGENMKSVLDSVVQSRA